MPSLYLIRHAPTKANTPGHELVRSQLGMRPTPEALRKWVKHVGKALDGKDISFVVSSDLPRGRDSGLALAEYLGLPHHAFIPTPELRTYSSGDEVAMKPYDEVEPILRYYVEHPDETPEGGEPFADHIVRAKLALSRLRELLHRSGRNGAAILHGNQFMILPHILAGEPVKYIKHGNLPRPGAAYELVI